MAGIRLRVRVQPRAAANTHRLHGDGTLHLRLTAPPVEGEANEALISYLSKRLDIPKRAVRIIGGAKSREKLVELIGISDSQMRALLG